MTALPLLRSGRVYQPFPPSLTAGLTLRFVSSSAHSDFSCLESTEAAQVPGFSWALLVYVDNAFAFFAEK